MFYLNVMAVVELTHRLLEPMIVRRRGAVINVSSTAAFQPVPYTTLYAATKSFVTSFSMALAEEVQPYGIRVVTLCPGATRTNFFQASQYGDQNYKVPGGMQRAEASVYSPSQLLTTSEAEEKLPLYLPPPVRPLNLPVPPVNLNVPSMLTCWPEVVILPSKVPQSESPPARSLHQ